MWDSIKAWFRSSLTIAWARLLSVGGLVLGVLQAVDITPAIPPQYWPYYLVAIGVFTELARRRSLPASEAER
jgi:hypothetical protein